MRDASETARPVIDASTPFEDFFVLERPRLFATLALIVGDRGIAEELMQEAFVRVWERWDRVQRHPDPTGYLYRTALNLVRQRRRRILRARPVGMPPDETDAFSLVDRREDLYAILRRLTPRQRAALVLTDLLDLDAKEAGRILGRMISMPGWPPLATACSPVTMRGPSQRSRTSVEDGDRGSGSPRSSSPRSWSWPAPRCW